MPTTSERGRNPGETAEATDEIDHPRGTLFILSATCFLAAALVVTILNLRAPFTRGWWLTAYLSLVGGIAQLLLGPGLLAIARRASSSTTPSMKGALRTEFILWNIGTLIVAIASMMRVPIGVPAGSVLLFAALALFTAKERTIRDAFDAREGETGWISAYAALRWFMILSVVAGNILAHRGYH